MDYQIKKVIQFGDTYEDGIFTFTPFEEEDDWSDETTPALWDVPQVDGAWRALGYSQSKKATKTITKRFVLWSKTIRDMYPDSNAFLARLQDYMYRTLKGGVKRLYAIREDGVVIYTEAEATVIPYTKSFSSAKQWLPFTVDFVAHDPYWYEAGAEYDTFFLNSTKVPLFNLTEPYKASLFSGITGYTQIVNKTNPLKIDSCDYQGVIVNKPELIQGYPNGCVPNGCISDQTALRLGDKYICNGDINFGVTVYGSAGATRPKVTFVNAFNYPSVKTGNNILQYGKNILNGQFLTLWLNTNNSGDVEDIEYETNINEFSLNDISINNIGYFTLKNGENTIYVTGGQSITSYFYFNFQNKYHN